VGGGLLLLQGLEPLPPNIFPEFLPAVVAAKLGGEGIVGKFVDRRTLDVDVFIELIERRDGRG